MQTNKQVAAGQRRKLERIKNELIDMASEWEDRDNFLVDVLNGAADNLAEIHKNMQVDNEY